MAKKHSFDVFLSYSTNDRSWASRFARSLRDSGVEAWFDEYELAPGERWQDSIQEALRASRFLVVLISESSMHSPWTFFELGAAVADNKRIISVVTEDVDIAGMPVLLRQFQFLREREPEEAARRVAFLITKGREDKA